MLYCDGGWREKVPVGFSLMYAGVTIVPRVLVSWCCQNVMFGGLVNVADVFVSRPLSYYSNRVCNGSNQLIL